MKKWTPLAETYDPLKCGSIDGTDTVVHDKAIHRATQARYKPNKGVKGDPYKTIFVGRLNHQTDIATVEQIFSSFGQIENVSLIRDVVTGHSRGYAFVEYKEKHGARKAYEEANNLSIDGRQVIVDYEHERTMKGWVPRRFGGGFGGKKESGQLRFGCRDRPFKRPIVLGKTQEQTLYRKHETNRYGDRKPQTSRRNPYYSHR